MIKMRKLLQGFVAVITFMGIMCAPQAAQAQTVPDFSSSVPQVHVPTPQELVKQYVPQQYYQYVPPQYRPQSQAQPQVQSQPVAQKHSRQQILNHTNNYRAMNGLPGLIYGK